MQESTLAKKARNMTATILTFFALIGATAQASFRARLAATGGDTGRVSLRALAAEERAESSVTKQAQQVMIGVVLFAVTIILTLLLWPLIAENVATAKADNNTGTSEASVIGMLGIFFLISVLASSLAFMFIGFRGLRSG